MEKGPVETPGIKGVSLAWVDVQDALVYTLVSKLYV